jgi:osmoprotectant transport system substrate-binding protein
MKMMKRITVAVLLLSFVGLMAACSGGGKDAGGQAVEKGKVVIGGKDFTEQNLLSKITAIYLKENGYKVEEAGSMGSTVVRNALENKQIDVYWEYTGTGLVVYQKQAPEADPEKAYEKVKETDKANKLIWLNKGDFNNTYTLLMKESTAKELNIKTYSDLSAFVNKNPDRLKFASNAEFYAREDGIKGLEKMYGFKFPTANVVKMDSGLLYNALKDGQVDVSVGFATDGRIQGFNLVSLEDDKLFFPAYNGAPVIRQEVLDKQPEVGDFLNQISAKLDTATMMQLNYAVDVEHKDVAEVSREWLVSVGLLK